MITFFSEAIKKASIKRPKIHENIKHIYLFTYAIQIGCEGCKTLFFSAVSLCCLKTHEKYKFIDFLINIL